MAFLMQLFGAAGGGTWLMTLSMVAAWTKSLLKNLQCQTLNN